MNESISNTQSPFILEKPRVWGTGLFVGLLITTVCAIFSYLIFLPQVNANISTLNKVANGNRGLIFASSIVIPLLIGAYLSAYNLFKDQFFFYVALYWILNLFYILMVQGWDKPEDNVNVETFLLIQTLLSFSSDFYLYIAAKISKTEKLNLKHLILPGSVLLLWFVIYFAPPSLLDTPTRIKILFIIGPIYACYVLVIAGISIYSRLDKSIYSRILSGTLIIYGILQIFFLLHSQWITEFFQFQISETSLASTGKFVFWISFLLKVINFIALVLLLRIGITKWIKEKVSADTVILSTNYQILQKNSELSQKEREIERLEKDKKLLAKEKELDEEKLSYLNEFADLGVLTATIEHELRTPLSVINSSIAIMREDYQSNKALLKDLDELDKELKSIQAATDIVDTLRSNKENLRAKMREIDVEAFIDRVIKNIKKEFEGKIDQIYFKINKQKEELFVRGFPVLLEKVFINFTKNAIESILSKSEKGVITYDLTTETKDKVIISISDNGPGFIDLDGNKIPDEKLNKIVEASYSTRYAEDSRANRGIGLFVCDKIVKSMHKGNMKFENLKDGGAKISVTLERYFTNKMRKKDRQESV